MTARTKMTDNRYDVYCECADDTDFKEEIDPAVKIELETLNQSATDINRLEKEIDEARAKYQSTFLESSLQLEHFKKKSGTSIKHARPYYELQEAAREAQIEALRSARKFQTSNGVYLAAKETISLAELRLMDDKAASLSAAWQEMLNHALLRVTESEKEKTASEQEHLKRAAVFADIEKKMHVLEKKHKRSIAKARPYFETKKELEIKLQQVKQSVEDLQQAFKAAKQRYSGALKRLEKISNSIHEQRRQKFLLMFPREPGVGAEDSKNTSESDPVFPTLSTTDDTENYDDGSYCDSDNDNSFYDDDGYRDINNESIFRAKVLTTSLDDDDTTFMRLKYNMKKHGKRSLKRTQSLPLYSDHRTNKSHQIGSVQVSFGSDGCFVERIFEKPLVPLSDRSESHPPDGDSLSNEKNIICDTSSCQPNNDINCGASQSLPLNHLDAFMTRSSIEFFEPEITERSGRILHNTCSHEDINKIIQKVNEASFGKVNETFITFDTFPDGLPEISKKVYTSTHLQINESFDNST